MLRDYRDIRQRLGDPLWWDDNGVPRYDAFAPDLCGVYDRYIAFNLVGCQGCDRQFKITAVITSIDMARDKVTLPTEHSVGSFHYGDPPAHGCVGRLGGSTQSVVAVDDERGEQVVAAREVPVHGGAHHAQLAGDRSQRERGRAVDRHLLAGDPQDLGGGGRPGSLSCSDHGVHCSASHSERESTALAFLVDIQ